VGATTNRSKIQQQLAEAWTKHRSGLFERRLDHARLGFKQYRDHKVLDAVQSYHTYLRILEEWKQVPEGGLRPDHFDMRKDAAEMLLLIGVYWDLVKVYDRAQGPNGTKDFKRYLEQYILFSRGTSHTNVAVETIRKYMTANKTRHKNEFRNAFKRLGGTDCFIVTSLMDHVDPMTLPVMRGFRDQSLVESLPGRVFVTAYYRVGPAIAWCLDRSPEWFRVRVAKTIDRLASRVR
jgi:hypothetical protein